MDHALTFGSFRFEPATARLWEGDTEVRLTRKAALVLGALLERPGEPVSKQDLFARVWRGTVVSDDALVTCIQELRKALRDDSKQPLYIETRHRLGYRFLIAPAANPTKAEAAIAVYAGCTLMRSGWARYKSTASITKKTPLSSDPTATGSARRGVDRTPSWPRHSWVRSTMEEASRMARGGRTGKM